MSAQTIDFQVMQRDQVERTLEIVQSTIDEALEQALSFDVCSQWAAEEAIDLITKVKGFSKKIEQARKSANEPYRRLMNLNNERVMPFSDKLGRIEYILKSKIESWKSKQENERKEQEEIEKQLNLPVNPFMVESIPNLKTADSLSYERTGWKFEVQCLAMVPINYMKIDE